MGLNRIVSIGLFLSLILLISSLTIAAGETPLGDVSLRRIPGFPKRPPGTRPRGCCEKDKCRWYCLCCKKAAEAVNTNVQPKIHN
ncbi:3-hydroxyanthranilate 3,4-dioxygenase [Dorcoceras hygrometricum]|uniref:3-hydroxyanthranilate 3,4-dioxygenase n=1 Tax=Dorcoceras hygrometricum TaxID=472368 RepID=A0A2Z7CC95_9LAMI|nr:3-hydroxyanthranilate 3,4-dioxygenase [Dorcoceras hygrometricum]